MHSARVYSWHYTYHEGLAKKGSNEVASFLLHFINNFLDDDVQKLRIFCDSCDGQNKNFTIFRFIHYVTAYQIAGPWRITMTFTIRGHSYLECDKNVGLLNLKTHEECSIDIENLIQNTRSRPFPFVVIRVNQVMIYD